jgi:hypothetical protein
LQENSEHGGSQVRPIPDDFQWLILPPEPPVEGDSTFAARLAANLREPKYQNRTTNMPSLLRFLTVVAVIAGIVYGVVFALANFVNPKPREMTVTIPADRFLKK